MLKNRVVCSVVQADQAGGSLKLMKKAKKGKKEKWEKGKKERRKEGKKERRKEGKKEK